MSNRLRNNLLATLFVLVALIAMVFLAGCAGKGLQVEVETSGEGANASKKVTVDTDYQVENGFTMERDGDGYKIDLGSATTKDAEAGVLIEMLGMFRAMLGVLVPGFDGGQGVTPPAPGLQLSEDDIYEAGILEGRRIQTEAFNGPREDD